MKILNTRIKKLRKALELTQQSFADRLGLKQNSIALIESGRKTSDQTIRNICREFHVNEEWLRTGGGVEVPAAPRCGVGLHLVELRAPRVVRSLTEKYLELTPAQQEAVILYMRKVAAGLMANEPAAQEKPVPPGYSSRAELEAEADEFAAMAREQFLSEKIPGYQAPSASGSDDSGGVA